MVTKRLSIYLVKGDEISMSQPVIQKKKERKFEHAKSLDYSNKWLPITYWNENPESSRPNSIYQPLFSGYAILTLLRSQVLLFNSRKKWGLLFAVATISGMFCVLSSLDQIQSHIIGSFEDSVAFLISLLVPISTLLIITGMYVLNDLFDADLDRINGKTNRPIPSGKVSKGHALLFVVLTNVIGLCVPVFTYNLFGIVLALMIALIGILYSLPKVSLKDKFIIKTCAIAIAMACSLLLGTSIYLLEDLGTDIGNAFRWISAQAVGLILYPAFAAVILAMMVFVTSPLNDLGDIKGDKVAGRRTIPIVIGKENTVRLSLLITIGIAFSSWIFYANSYIESDWTELHNNINAITMVLPLSVSGTCLLVIFHLWNVLKRTEDQNYVRESIGKKSMPLHSL
jgi:geranylgeranylglycerol-phosphate geranylgeranyltransferase